MTLDGYPQGLQSTGERKRKAEGNSHKSEVNRDDEDLLCSGEN